MTATATLLPPPAKLDEALQPIHALASQTDQMCLGAGQHLSDAFPGLNDLSGRFASLGEMLDSEAVATATQDLERIAGVVGAIGAGLSSEREALDALMALNQTLSLRIADVASNIRFLSAMVPNVKVELASSDREEVRLEGFARNLEQLTAKARGTLGEFQFTHNILVEQLRRTVTAQYAFEQSHRVKLVAVAQQVEAGLGAMSARRQSISSAAAEIATATQQISAQIAETVVALQVGDSTRQRIEQVYGALTGLTRRDHDAPGGMQDAAVARACQLQDLQLTAAAAEFSAEVTTIRRLLLKVGESNAELAGRGETLFASQAGSSRSFVGDLEADLHVAQRLIDDCQRSRGVVDTTATTVISTAVKLEHLALDVAEMATDMAIIGTNAIVTSFRLGTQGAALSIMAQHLRSHALHVEQSVQALKPSLEAVLLSAKTFIAAREGQDAAAMAELASGMNGALDSFRAADAALTATRRQLEQEAGTVGGALRQALASLDPIAEVNTQLRSAASVLRARGADGAAADATVDSWLHGLLRPRYTMTAERKIHDAFFAHVEPDERPAALSA